jgi:hypothetical protein
MSTFLITGTLVKALMFATLFFATILFLFSFLFNLVIAIALIFKTIANVNLFSVILKYFL